jgi:hypothetical protein
VTLVELTLSSTAVTGTLTALAPLKNLTVLRLAHTAATGSVQAGLSALPSLATVDLQSTGVGGDLQGLRAFASLQLDRCAGSVSGGRWAQHPCKLGGLR